MSKHVSLVTLSKHMPFVAFETFYKWSFRNRWGFKHSIGGTEGFIELSRKFYRKFLFGWRKQPDENSAFYFPGLKWKKKLFSGHRKILKLNSTIKLKQLLSHRFTIKATHYAQSQQCLLKSWERIFNPFSNGVTWMTSTIFSRKITAAWIELSANWMQPWRAF